MSTGRSGLGVEMQVEGAGIVDTVDARYRWCVHPQPLGLVATEGSQQHHFPDWLSANKNSCLAQRYPDPPLGAAISRRQTGGEYESTATLSQGGMGLWCQHAPELPVASV